jgi:hypothetical protein
MNMVECFDAMMVERRAIGDQSMQCNQCNGHQLKFTVASKLLWRSKYRARMIARSKLRLLYTPVIAKAIANLKS